MLSGAAAARASAQAAPSEKPPSSPKSAESPAFQRIADQAAQTREADRSDEAIGLYLKALKLNPRWNEGWWYLGTLYYEGDRYSDAASAFHNLVELSPAYGPGLAMLGLCEFELHDYKNSFVHLQSGRVKGLGSNQELIHVTRYHQALIEILGGSFDEAMTLLSSLVNENVLSNQVKLAMGVALLHVPLLPEQVDPSKDALVSAAGNVAELEALSDFDAAKKEFEKLIQDYPSTPFLHYAYGAMLATLSEYKPAEEELLAEIKINPDSSMPYMQLAYVDIKLNRYDDALPLARHAVTLVPESFAAHYLLGRALLETGQVYPSIKELNIAKRLGPFSPEVRYNLARALTRAKQPKQAAVEQAEFERLNAMVEKAKQKLPPQSYRDSSDRGDTAPHQIQPPAPGDTPPHQVEPPPAGSPQ